MDDPKILILARELMCLTAPEFSLLCDHIKEEYNVHMELTVNHRTQHYMGEDDVTPPAEDTYTVTITGYGEGKKIAMIRIVRAALMVGLAEAKRMVEDQLPLKVGTNHFHAEALALQNEIRSAGGQATVTRNQG